MPSQARGEFEVQLSPQNPEPQIAAAGLRRLLIDKEFRGDLQGRSMGQMISAGTDVAGSAGYVAMEKVTGNLLGRNGSFVLQHSGTMERGMPSLSINVVPDSGTDSLLGLRGEMQIVIEDGKHYYEFDYEFGSEVEEGNEIRQPEED
jgi:hypothetical protein